MKAAFIFSSSLCFSLQLTHTMVTKFPKWLDFWRQVQMTIRFIKVDTIRTTNNFDFSSWWLIFRAYVFSVAILQQFSFSLISLIKSNAARSLYIGHSTGNENVICKLMTWRLSKYNYHFLRTTYFFPVRTTIQRYNLV